LRSQEGELEKCHVSDYSGIPDFLQFAATAGGLPPHALSSTFADTQKRQPAGCRSMCDPPMNRR
jgi:hypothetical protein